ncbi:MAG: acetyl-CoA carboxylase, carboxyltransferase subunit beta [Tractidigestivibacter sp.]|jgi:acetyl-CoA carboxylase carboxyl transferase beta subunit/acetyl-CoA carboxylase carboxyl transferase alpha subunit|uniref:acetyl-CoA carboxylase, carboxyltransferase subunit beta n=1 Tax=Tractidigestivibacter sp. TaxID=2847320 RepID=UPI003D8A5A57
MSNRRDKSVNELESPATDVEVEMPQRHILVKCPGCRRIIDQEQLHANMDVCPRCGHHLRVSGRDRLKITVDEGNFQEWDAELAVTDFLNFPGYATKLDTARAKTGDPDAVVCGRGTVGGHDCVLFFMDHKFMMGSMGSVVGEKICRCFERATDLGLPVVGFTVSGGARMQEGLMSLMQMAKVSAAVRRHSEAGLLYLAVLTDPTTGGVTASFAMEADIALAEPGALIGFAGPRVIEQTTHKKLPAGFQRSEFLLDHGFVDMIVERSKMKATIAELLSLHEGVAPGADAPHAIAHESASDGHGLGELVAEPLKHVLDLLPNGRGETASDASGQGIEPTAYEIIRNTRSTDRATSLDLMEAMLDGFVELHGDRLYGEDPAVVAGIGWRGERILTVIGIERGRNTKDRIRRNFGMANPEGYRKARRLMEQAEKFGRPVVCFIDTSGAYCGIGAEERGQGDAIAQNLVVMSGLRVPIVSAVVGEGGSGGALALGVADRVLMLGSAAYSVVSPEACASILWKDTEHAPDAAQALHLTAKDLSKLGLIDEVVDDSGADAQEVSSRLATAIDDYLDELSPLSADELVGRRYDKFRAMGGNRLCSIS